MVGRQIMFFGIFRGEPGRRGLRRQGRRLRDVLANIVAAEAATYDWPPCVTPEADKKAERLLRENLSPNQRNQFDQLRWFEVRGGDTGKRYRIRYGQSMNIDELRKDGRIACRW